MEGPKKIEFLFWEECPSHHQCYDRLEDTMREEGIQAPIVRIEVTTDQRALEIGFLGSPTILVDGRDIDHAAGRRRVLWADLPYISSRGRPHLPLALKGDHPARAILRAEQTMIRMEV